MAQSFTKAVNQGYGTTLGAVDYDTPDYTMLRNMERDVFKFSAAKSFNMNEALSQLLKEGDRIRSYTEFRSEALKTVDTWVNAWGQAEYTTIISTSQNNADWVRFKENEDVMPLIRRSGVHDARECPICAEYDDLTAPIGDPVWSYAYGDLHFRDRCRMIQVAHGTATPAHKIPSSDAIPEAFRVNLAEKMKAMPPGHPYYDVVPKKQLKIWVNQNAPNRDK